MTAETAPRMWDPKRCYIGFAQDGTHINAQDGNFFDEAGALLADEEVPTWVREQIRRMGGLRALAQGVPRKVYACPLCRVEVVSAGELLDHLKHEHKAVLPMAARAAPAAAAPVPAEEDPDRDLSEYEPSAAPEFPAGEAQGEESAGDSPEENDGEPRAAQGSRRRRPGSRRRGR